MGEVECLVERFSGVDRVAFAAERGTVVDECSGVLEPGRGALEFSDRLLEKVDAGGASLEQTAGRAGQCQAFVANRALPRWRPLEPPAFVRAPDH